MNKKRRIHIIGSVGVPACYGGWETLVEYLLPELYGKFDVTVYCSSKAYQRKLHYYSGAVLRYVNLRANGLSSILYDFYSMLLATRNSDVQLILGVSGCIFLPIIRFIYSGKIIVAIDGMEWKRDKWNMPARLFLKFSEYFAVRFAHIVIADNKQISNYIFSTYGKNSELVTYGADHVKKIDLSDDCRHEYGIPFVRYAFKVARIEPENNIECILDSFSISRTIKLVIVGNWNNSKYGRTLRKRFSSDEFLILLDPIYDLFRLDQLRSNCSLYIHGHSAGGTNPSLVEAMMLGLPVITFDVIFNRYSTGNLAQYFKNQEDLSLQLLNLDWNDLTTKGDLLRVYAQDNYSWKVIGEKYKRLFGEDL